MVSAVPDHNIRMESTLHMKHRVGRGMHILVRTFGNTTLVVQVKLSDTIQDVKEKIQDMEGIPTWEQRYIFRTRQLEDGRTLASYGVEKGSTLCLVVWSYLLRGYVNDSEYLPYVAYLRESRSSFPNFYAWYHMLGI
jgi:ubiquitin